VPCPFWRDKNFTSLVYILLFFKKTIQGSFHHISNGINRETAFRPAKENFFTFDQY